VSVPPCFFVVKSLSLEAEQRPGSKLRGTYTTLRLVGSLLQTGPMEKAMKRLFGSSSFLTVLALPSLAALTQAQSAVETKKFSFVPNYLNYLSPNTVSYTGTMPLPLPTEGGIR
jgi:hypothetical protein